MRIQKKKSEDKKQKRKQSVIEAEIFKIVNKSLKSALDVALNDIFKEWK